MIGKECLILVANRMAKIQGKNLHKMGLKFQIAKLEKHN